jgi:hypothetical protein
MTALARTSSNCKRQTRSLVRESAPHQQIRNYLTVTKIWSQAPDGCLTPRHTGRLTVGRNITLTLTLSSVEFHSSAIELRGQFKAIERLVRNAVQL